MARSLILRKLLLTSFLLVLAALGSADLLLTRYTTGREIKHAQQELEGQIRILAPQLATIDPATLAAWADRAGEQAARASP